MKPRIVLIEPSRQLESLVQSRFAASVPPVRVVNSIEDAQAGMQAIGPLLVIARNDGDHTDVARIACAFDLKCVAMATRLIVLTVADPVEGLSAGKYLQALDHCLARLNLGFTQDASPLHLQADFPTDLYGAISRIGKVPSACMFLVRNRLTERKQLLVEIADAGPASARVWSTLYAEFWSRNTPEVMVHEITCHHSFVVSPNLPYDFSARIGYEDATGGDIRPAAQLT